MAYNWPLPRISEQVENGSEQGELGGHTHYTIDKVRVRGDRGWWWWIQVAVSYAYISTGTARIIIGQDPFLKVSEPG